MVSEGSRIEILLQFRQHRSFTQERGRISSLPTTSWITPLHYLPTERADLLSQGLGHDYRSGSTLNDGYTDGTNSVSDTYISGSIQEPYTERPISFKDFYYKQYLSVQDQTPHTEPQPTYTSRSSNHGGYLSAMGGLQGSDPELPAYSSTMHNDRNQTLEAPNPLSLLSSVSLQVDRPTKQSTTDSHNYIDTHSVFTGDKRSDVTQGLPLVFSLPTSSKHQEPPILAGNLFSPGQTFYSDVQHNDPLERERNDALTDTALDLISTYERRNEPINMSLDSGYYTNIKSLDLMSAPYSEKRPQGQLDIYEQLKGLDVQLLLKQKPDLARSLLNDLPSPNFLQHSPLLPLDKNLLSKPLDINASNSFMSPKSINVPSQDFGASDSDSDQEDTKTGVVEPKESLNIAETVADVVSMLENEQSQILNAKPNNLNSVSTAHLHEQSQILSNSKPNINLPTTHLHVKTPQNDLYGEYINIKRKAQLRAEASKARDLQIELDQRNINQAHTVEHNLIDHNMHVEHNGLDNSGLATPNVEHPNRIDNSGLDATNVEHPNRISNSGLNATNVEHPNRIDNSVLAVTNVEQTNRINNSELAATNLVHPNRIDNSGFAAVAMENLTTVHPMGFEDKPSLIPHIRQALSNFSNSDMPMTIESPPPEYVYATHAPPKSEPSEDGVKSCLPPPSCLLVPPLPHPPPSTPEPRSSTPKNPPSKDLSNQCQHCQKMFSQRGNLEKHIRAVHLGARPFECDICGKAFGYKHAMIKHKVCHTNEKPFSCEECGRSFRRLDTLVQHRQTHLDDKDKKYTCPVCSRKFTQIGGLTQHVSTHTGVKKYKCDLCPRQFGQRRHLRDHSWVHTGTKPYICEICGKTYAQKDRKTLHMKEHEGKVYNCHICEKQFHSEAKLKVHTRNHNKPFPCTVCDFRFTQRSHLNTHMKKHAEKSVIVCELCEESFLTVQGLTQHTQRAHGEKSVNSKLFNCKLCSKGFTRKTVLYAHNRKVHPESAPQYSCNECDLDFKSRKELNTHMKSHFENYKCELCKKKFKLESRLIRHVCSSSKAENNQTRELNNGDQEDDTSAGAVDLTMQSKLKPKRKRRRNVPNKDLIKTKDISESESNVTVSPKVNGINAIKPNEYADVTVCEEAPHNTMDLEAITDISDDEQSTNADDDTPTKDNLNNTNGAIHKESTAKTFDCENNVREAKKRKEIEGPVNGIYKKMKKNKGKNGVTMNHVT
ncbi:unnamed protein product [Owenia fusiformis]|uniref:Uncharacterized protein n=1 Tax=Owenia fusiformis TaxID=6347 RepID=A0A8J1T8S4_OWEFU|nr:unnamed protein product [Owenia fusiformis]